MYIYISYTYIKIIYIYIHIYCRYFQFHWWNSTNYSQVLMPSSFGYTYIWVNYNDLTASALEPWFISGNHRLLWPQFRLGNFINLPRIYMVYIVYMSHIGHIMVYMIHEILIYTLVYMTYMIHIGYIYLHLGDCLG